MLPSDLLKRIESGDSKAAREARMAALEEELASLKRLVVRQAAARPGIERPTAQNSSDATTSDFDAEVSIVGIER